MTTPRELSPAEAVVELEWVFRTAQVIKTGGSWCFKHGLSAPPCTKCPRDQFPQLGQYQARAMAILAPGGPTIPDHLR